MYCVVTFFVVSSLRVLLIISQLRHPACLYFPSDKKKTKLNEDFLAKQLTPSTENQS